MTVCLWMTTLTEVFPCFSSVVRQMPGWCPQRRGTVRTLPHFCVVLCIFCVALCIFCVTLCIFCVTLCIFCVALCIFCVVLCDVCFVTFPVLFVCICVLNICHRVATQLQLNIYIYIIIYIYISYIIEEKGVSSHANNRKRQIAESSTHHATNLDAQYAISVISKFLPLKFGGGLRVFLKFCGFFRIGTYWAHCC
jgi:hypothetical protein